MPEQNELPPAPDQIPTLALAEPQRGTLLWMRNQIRKNAENPDLVVNLAQQEKNLMSDASVAKEILNPDKIKHDISTVTLLDYAGLAANTADYDLMELVQVHRYYHNTEFSEEEQKRHDIISRNFYHARALDLREQSYAYDLAGNMKRGSETLAEAEQDYIRYKILYSSLEGGKTSEITSPPLQQVAENIQDINILFTPEVIAATANAYTNMDKVEDGEIEIPNLDVNWLRVFIEVVPDPKKFPEADKALETVVEFTASQSGVSPEAIMRCMMFQAKKAFFNQQELDS